jgi:adenylyltransferase/sulfurtransferase
MHMQLRYQRQQLLPEVGEAGQAAISRLRVLCVGVGGLGCPALLYLAAAGAGQLTLVDDDRVELSNLQRQVLFATGDLGAFKAEAGAVRLRALNPDIRVSAVSVRLGPENVAGMVEEHDIVIDCSDNFATQYLLNDACVKMGRPLVFAAIQAWEAQVSLFNAGPGTPCLRCVFPAPPAGHVPSCAEAGVMGAMAGMVGTVQALEVLKWALLQTHPDAPLEILSGQLWVLDSRSMASRCLQLRSDPDCAVCSAPGDIRLQADTDRVCTATGTSAIKAINPDDPAFDNLCREALVLDVRPAHMALQFGSLDNTRSMPLEQLMADENALAGVDPESPVLVYCQVGVRSRQACAFLQARGFTNVHELEGGFQAWLSR